MRVIVGYVSLCLFGNMSLFYVFDRSNLAPDAQFTTQSWIERIVIVGATKPSKVTVKTAGESQSNRNPRYSSQSALSDT